MTSSILAGPPAARARLEAILHKVLTRPRDAAALKADVLKMRADMAAHKQPAGPLDATLLRGGLVDCEFIIHFLQLRERIGQVPSLGEAIDRLAEAGLVPLSLRAAHDAMTRLLVAARLLAPDSQIPPDGVRAPLASACGYDDWEALISGFADARKAVAAVWHDVFGETLKLEK